MKRTRGFTMIELLIVIGVLALTFPLIFAVLFQILQQQARIYQLIEVKREGDFILNSVEYILKNRVATVYNSTGVQVCTTGTGGIAVSGIHFKDKDNTDITYSLVTSGSTHLFASNSAILTTAKTNVTNFSLSCTRTNTWSPPLISVRLVLENYPKSSREKENISLDYRTKVKLKSY
ncbi:prepilin-type N-terminal cleavage/methylation domain-containing protein [Candidatus Roizmanbacteria bacterium]|nr:prepilin-type N-terminal cleavage/methylation domain-containing protein [Candidatus Roizmanbacteria bacterium]